MDALFFIYDLKMTSAKRKYIQFFQHTCMYLRKYTASFSTVKHAISENTYNELTLIMMK